MTEPTWLEAEGDRLLEFARAAAHPDGGFAWLDDDGRPLLDRPVELWISCRMTHVFALAHLMGRPDAAALVDHGIAALTGRLRDAEHGGWYAAVAADGPVTRDKTAYEHAFVVLAASSATAAGRPGAAELLTEALDVFDRHFWDEGAGMAVEQWDESWSTLDDYRGVNANMHTVEALLAAADVTGDARWRERARRIVTTVVHGFARDNHWRIPEHFDARWRPRLDYNRAEPAHPFRPYGATVGHWFEWSRLALGLREALGAEAPDWLLDDAQALFDAGVREGWAVDGAAGFVYTVDWDGTPVVRQRMHWVATEALAAAATLSQVTHDPVYAVCEEVWWRYAEQHLIDHERGSWHHELDPHNRPTAGTWAGKPDVYHAFQATLAPRLPVSPAFARALADGRGGFEARR
ncbi:AGE family epimerase/isomerase [Nocardioides sp. URHA0020]|uniref:AGE family epimerase/isomerase n=1 Tax=Nocardioides sp. URHA0020 TaxID=1380392 RepID=UPI00049080D4|nr:AGE family epimerase/isomerase [Nocardioides sp. URHA0020]